MKHINYRALATEQPNPRSRGLDRMTPRQIVRLMNREDRRVVAAVAAAAKDIAASIDLVTGSFRQGGRLFLVGAGTSGRLGVIEAAECPPTFNTSSSQVQALMAGGRSAVFRSKEGAEDSRSKGRIDIRRQVKNGDVVVGVAASGVTPFVRAALRAAHRLKAKTVLITCNDRFSAMPFLDRRIVLRVGPEVLAGSTRLKSGTACKMVLNMLTTGSLIQCGKVYDNWMVDLQPKSRKLVARGLHLIRRLGRVSPFEAKRLFRAARGRVKVAIAMARTRATYAEALDRLEKADGFLREVLKQVKA
jgi:N-acetylmuramic acid 6-phosphate etherase